LGLYIDTFLAGEVRFGVVTFLATTGCLGDFIFLGDRIFLIGVATFFICFDYFSFATSVIYFAAGDFVERLSNFFISVGTYLVIC